MSGHAIAVATMSPDRIAATFALPEPVAARLVSLAEARGQVAAHASAAAWLAAECARLRRAFVDPEESPTDHELHLLAVLAVLADARGELTVPRSALCDTLRIDSHAMSAAEAWGAWRGSFRVRRVSTPGSPRVSAFRLRPLWPSEAPR